MEPVIQCRALKKFYGTSSTTVTALQGVTLDIMRQETFMLVGPSGCGKTTLISIIAAILEPSEGTCIVLGQNVGTMKSKDKIKFRAENIGFVFQSFNLLPALTAAENVAVPLLINKVPRRLAIHQARELLYEVDLGDRGDALPAQLSGGQQQRVAIARALIHHPQIIVCDEPTSALDNRTGQKVMTLMQQLSHDRGHTLVIVTHDNRILNYAHRIGHMDDGKIMSIGTLPESTHYE
jgi:putative ABC transport system ATP-binding protein